MNGPRHGVPPSLERVGIIAANTFVEAVRQKIFTFLLVISISLVLSAQLFRDFNFGSSELKFITDFGVGAVVLFGSILAIVATAQLFFNEIENKTALTILAKPVYRAEFIFGKFTGVWLVLLVFCLLMTVLMAGVLYTRETALMRSVPESFPDGRLIRYGDLVVFALTQWIKLGVVVATTILIASFSSTNLFTAAISFFVLIICHLQYLARDSWQDLAFWAARAGAWLLSVVFPNFQIFNFGDSIALSRPIDLWVAGSVCLYGLTYVLILNSLAVLSFRTREI